MSPVLKEATDSLKRLKNELRRLKFQAPRELRGTIAALEHVCASLQKELDRLFKGANQ